MRERKIETEDVVVEWNSCLLPQSIEVLLYTKHILQTH